MLKVGGALLACVLATGAGCAHPGITIGGACDGAAVPIAPVEQEVLAAVARTFYRSGRLTVARTTRLEEAWIEDLMAGGDLVNLASDLGARNGARGCVDFDARALHAASVTRGPHQELSLSRPGVDVATDSAIVVYELRGDGHAAGPDAGFVLLRRQNGAWRVTASGVAGMPSGVWLEPGMAAVRMP